MANDTFLQINKVLAQYTKNINSDLDQVMSSVAQEAKQKLKVDSPQDSGDFAKGWAVEHSKGEYVVYNKQHYLTHLLENGHDVVAYGKKVGHVSGQNFIKPVNDWVSEEVVKRLEEKL